MNRDLFRRDLEAKPAALRALADDLGHLWDHIGQKRRVVMLGMGSSATPPPAACARMTTFRAYG